VITHFSRHLGGDASVPVIRMKPVSNFDFFLAVNFLMQKSTIADKHSIRSDNYRER
jgi:hypothetical protein